MPRLASLLCLAGAISSGVPGCINASDATDVAEDHRAIVRGSADTGDPAVALLDLGDGICTGTLISPRVIVTAQHCLVGPASAITAHFVNEYGEMGRPMAAATASETHPTADIGAIALAEPITSITPIPLNTTPIEGALGQTVRFVGFGVTSESGQDSGLKRQGSSTLSSTSPDGIDFFQGEMATATGGQSTCYGDSGGPNFMTFGGTEYIAGITSRGTDDCGIGLDIAVRIDAHMDFLRSFIERNDAATCTADGRCTEGCATVDPDCCVADSACNEACGASDTDCADPTDPGGSGDGDGRNYEGGCSAAGAGAPGALWLIALAFGVVLARRRAVRVAAIPLIVLSGCGGGLAGDYEGTLLHVCGLQVIKSERIGPDGQTIADVARCSGGESTSGYVLAVRKGPADGKLAVDVDRCHIVLSERDDGSATVDPGQSCPLALDIYTGPAIVSGELSGRDGEIQLHLYFHPEAKQASGAHTATFSGNRRS